VKTQADLLRFGDFELDVGAYRLQRAGRDVRLEQQPMDLLILLVQRRPHLVSREEIVERLWGTETFVEAEAGINTAVRKVRQALGDSATTPTLIERVPGKGYRFVGEVIDPNRPVRRSSRSLVFWSAAGVVFTATLFVLVSARDKTPPLAPYVQPLTKLTGTERDPTFSPDARQVAFAWDSAREDNFDIYVTLVGSAEVRRLTTDPAQDLSPTWSPDGRQIAYVRIQPPGTTHQLRVMSALGGDDRAVTDFPVWYQSSWSPDGRFLAAGRAVLPGVSTADNGIYLITVATGQSRALTRPEYGSDYQPSISPDGRRVAYASCRDATFKFQCHVRVQPLDKDLQPVGTPLALTRDLQSRISGVTWSRDGLTVYYGAGTPTSALWRVRADGAVAPQRVEEATDGAYPAAARSIDRVVFSRGSFENHLYRFEPGRAAQPIAPSAGQNGQPDFSPDGRRVAFCSDRSGTTEVWTAAADGTELRQLTRGSGPARCSPAWSPDGGRIAFDSPDVEGVYQIWIMAADGGSPRQLTQGSAQHNVPRWSRDGRWIYVSSTRGGTRDIWRMDVETRQMEQITHGGSGFWSSEAPDRRGVLYSASNADSPLLFQAYTGGAPRDVRPCIAAGSIAVTSERDIYYLPCAKEGVVLDQPVHQFDPATGIDRRLGVLDGYRRPRDVFTPSFRKMALSSDGRQILYTRRLPAMADLMVIENLR
jgi:Tol biopolymer transport system component/DNA-binding winged helix-turn-helix (wHTH) protein